MPLTSTRRSSAHQRGAPGAFTARRTLSPTSMCGPPHDMPYHERVGRPIGDTRPLAPRHRGAGDQNSGKGTGLWAYTQGGHPLTAWRGNVQGRTHGAIAPAGPIFLHGACHPFSCPSAAGITFYVLANSAALAGHSRTSPPPYTMHCSLHLSSSSVDILSRIHGNIAPTVSTLCQASLRRGLMTGFNPTHLEDKSELLGVQWAHPVRPPSFPQGDLSRHGLTLSGS